MIVLADADVERAANAAVFWSMQNTGQTCISVERVYVEEPIYDDFVALVANKARDLRQGVPGAFGSVDVGSFINPPQIEIVEAHVKDAIEKGARVLTGGTRGTGDGAFYAPTVLTDVDHTMDCMTEETFGPTLPIMKVARQRRGDPARQRLAVRPTGVGLHQGCRQGRGRRAQARGRRRRDQ